jgi:hypothetical protein
LVDIFLVDNYAIQYKKEIIFIFQVGHRIHKYNKTELSPCAMVYVEVSSQHCTEETQCNGSWDRNPPGYRLVAFM